MKAYVGVIAVVVALSFPAMAKSIDAEKVAEDVTAKYLTAYNKNDAAALATLYTQDVVLLPPTGAAPVVGRADNEKRLGATFAADGPALKLSVTSAQKLDNRTIVGVGEWYYTPSRGSNAGKESHGRWMAVYIAQKGTWRVKALSNNIALPPPAPSANKQ